MHAIVDPAEVDATAIESVAKAVLGDGAPATITTTLYDLIVAIQEAVGPDDNALAVATVWHVLHSGRVTWHGDVVTGID
jgi:hypothetical protein